MGPGVGHGASGVNHGNMSSSNSGSAHGVTVNQILSKNTALASKMTGKI
jgi:hypothetical protein